MSLHLLFIAQYFPCILILKAWSSPAAVRRSSTGADATCPLTKSTMKSINVCSSGLAYSPHALQRPAALRHDSSSLQAGTSLAARPAPRPLRSSALQCRPSPHSAPLRPVGSVLFKNKYKVMTAYIFFNSFLFICVQGKWLLKKIWISLSGNEQNRVKKRTWRGGEKHLSAKTTRKSPFWFHGLELNVIFILRRI